MHILFLQPFGISSLGGGARILRALLKDAPVPWTSICTSPEAPPPTALGEEIHLPTRPGFGRIERSRFVWIPNRLDPLFARRFTRKLESTCRRLGATAFHAIPHGLDFAYGWRIAQKLRLKFFFNVHDDVQISVGRHSTGAAALQSVPEIWRDADARFVISERMGREYCQRYGTRDYLIVTDGIEHLAKPRPRVPGRLHIYFMGLFHLRYEPNLAALLRAIEILRSKNPGTEVTATFRCGSIHRTVTGSIRGIRVLPFGTEADVKADMQDADLLYLPLPFSHEDAGFVRYSLSTKMITYLGSGVPILYHGPRAAGAFQLLSEDNAALVADSLEPEALVTALSEAIGDPSGMSSCAERALQLARRSFMLEDQRRRFWAGITGEAAAAHVAESPGGAEQ